MVASIDDLSATSRVWVYNIDRLLSESEIQSLNHDLNRFLKDWTAHSDKLKAACKIRFLRHIVIMVDENIASASGCSIDASVRFINKLGQHYSFDAFDRLNYTYLSGGDPIIISHYDLQEAYDNQVIADDTQFVNPLVKSKAEYQNDFLVPLKNSFLNRFIDNLAPKK
jgi:hypothetical protein